MQPTLLTAHCPHAKLTAHCSNAQLTAEITQCALRTAHFSRAKLNTHNALLTCHTTHTAHITSAWSNQHSSCSTQQNALFALYAVQHLKGRCAEKMEQMPLMLQSMHIAHCLITTYSYLWSTFKYFSLEICMLHIYDAKCLLKVSISHCMPHPCVQQTPFLHRQIVSPGRCSRICTNLS